LKKKRRGHFLGRLTQKTGLVEVSGD
jgi:hypothetical protein